ncbi:MAG: pyridoxamine 5'-phosphate oxidase family protein [Pseudomonadota bacterium]
MSISSDASTPFHRGEEEVQRRQGVYESVKTWGSKVVRDYLPEQHQEFYAQQPFVIAAARDGQARPWVTVLTGKPGFLTSPTVTTMDFSVRLPAGDALGGALTEGAQLGLLGIELATRRRNRVNGTITATRGDGFSFDVGQTFGNCPQYISERHWKPATAPVAGTSVRGQTLTADQRALIANAGTFFIGSGISDDDNRQANGLDASHRGGPSGFVEVQSPSRIVFPDYAGNNHFNTIGNLLVDPRVGLLFVDFEKGSLLQITGRATIDWDSDAVGEHAGAQRLVIIDIEETVQQNAVLPMRFSPPESMVRDLRLVDRRQESDDVVSFYFASRDDGDLPDFKAGQHLPLELHIEGFSAPVGRTYSLSNGPGQGVYRISVKREPRGLVSRALHDSLQVGNIIHGRDPAGDFTLPEGSRPVVLISAGIGVTPMLSMLHQLAARDPERPVVFIHGARNGRLHAMREEVNMISQNHKNLETLVAYSQPLPEDRIGEHYDLEGRIDSDAIRHAVGDLQADYFLCGPASFLGAMSDMLSGLGIEENHVHVEQF